MKAVAALASVRRAGVQQFFGKLGDAADYSIAASQTLFAALAVTIGQANHRTAGSPGGKDVIGGITHHQPLLGLNAEMLASVQQRGWIGFFQRQGIAAQAQREIAVQLQGRQQGRNESLGFVGNAGQRNARNMQSLQAFPHAGIYARAAAIELLIVAAENRRRISRHGACAKTAAHQMIDAPADMGLYGDQRQRSQLVILQHGIRTGGQIMDAVDQGAIEIEKYRAHGLQPLLQLRR